jgi:hypothetical protein
MPAMRSNDTTLEKGGNRPRLPHVAAAVLGAVLAAALVSAALCGALPMPAWVEAAAPVLAAGSGPARPSVSRLCFHGPEGDLLDLAPSGKSCP